LTQQATAGTNQSQTSLSLTYDRIGLITDGSSLGYDRSDAKSIDPTSLPSLTRAGLGSVDIGSETKYFMSIDGFNGGAVNANAKGWFELNSFEFSVGAAAAAALNAGGPSVSAPKFDDLRVSLTGISPVLLGQLAGGSQIDAVSVRGLNAAGAIVYDLRLADVLLTSNTFALDGSDDSGPSTSLSFNYGQIGLTTPASNFGWNIGAGTTVPAASIPQSGPGGTDVLETTGVSRFYLLINDGNAFISGQSKAWFEISSLQLGSGVGVTDGLAGRPAFSDLTVNFSGASPSLLATLASGNPLYSIQVQGIDSERALVYDLRLKDVYLTGNQLSGAGGNDAPQSSLSFSYDQIGLITPTARSQRSNSFGYDRSERKSIEADSLPSLTKTGADYIESGWVAQYFLANGAVAHYYLLMDNGSGLALGDSKGRIEIDSLQFGAGRAGFMAGTAPTEPNFKDLNLTIKSLSPYALNTLATGGALQAFQIQGVSSTGVRVYDLRLGDAAIQTYAFNDVEGSTTTSLSFSYDRIGVITPSGSFGYNMRTDGAIDPISIRVPTFTFEVAPVETLLTAAVGEDGPTFSQNLLAGASDPYPGTTLTVQNLDATVTTSGGRMLTLGSDYTLNGSTLTLTVNGVDDKAVLGTADVSVAETNAPITTTGRLTLVDADGPAAFVAQPATAGRHGNFTLGTDGTWTYRANLAFDYLNPGDSLQDTFQVKSTDGGTSSVSVTITGTAEVGTVRLGDAPVGQSGTGGQWAQAWTQTGYAITHKADATNAAEAWSSVRFNAVSPQQLSGGDIFAGDLGVSGQSAATSSVRQEIDGKEALRISLPSAATSVTVGLTRLFINDGGSTFSESGLLRLLNASGAVVAEKAFWADAANGLKTVTLDAASGFTSMELLAGAYNTAGNFVHGGYSSAAGGFGGAIFNDAAGAHGSDFMLDRVDFVVPLMGIVKKALAGLLTGLLLSNGALAGVVVGTTPFAGEAFGEQSDPGSTAQTQLFITPADTIVEAIRWWGVHGQDSGGASFDNFVVMLGGVELSGTLSVITGSLFDEYTLDIVDAALTASVLSIFNNSTEVEWYWQRTAAVGNPTAASTDTFAYSLLGPNATGGTVDEPATLALLLAAAVGLDWSRRRRGGAGRVRLSVPAARCA